MLGDCVWPEPWSYRRAASILSRLVSPGRGRVCETGSPSPVAHHEQHYAHHEQHYAQRRHAVALECVLTMSPASGVTEFEPAQRQA